MVITNYYSIDYQILPQFDNFYMSIPQYKLGHITM